MMNTVTNLGRNDLRIIGRDSFLSGMVIYILAVSVLLRFALPWVAESIAANPDIALNVPSFYPLLIGYIVLFASAMVGGVVFGFLLIDERDQNTLDAMLVTPLPMSHYLGYRIVIPALAAFAVVMAEMYIINIALIPVWQFVPIAMGAGLVGSAVALILATFSGNKVEGFATMKIIGGSGLILLAAWFVQAPLQYLFGLFPPYWIVKAYWAAYAGESAWWVFLLIGFVMMGASIWLLARRFVRVAYS